MESSFRLARMSPLILGLTLLLFALPFVFLAKAFFGNHQLAIPALIVIAAYSWIWLRFRPTLFVIRPEVLEVIWPLKRRQIRRKDILSVRLMNKQDLRHETGWCMRVGAGGLWGGFGWLWTRRRGILQMYISRTDHFVWVERVSGRPWLITPEQPEAFVRALSGAGK